MSTGDVRDSVLRSTMFDAGEIAGRAMRSFDCLNCIDQVELYVKEILYFGR